MRRFGPAPLPLRLAPIAGVLLGLACTAQPSASGPSQAKPAAAPAQSGAVAGGEAAPDQDLAGSPKPSGLAGSPKPSGLAETDPNAPAAICRRALACSSNCYAEAQSPKQSLPECADPASPACAAALAAAAPPDLPTTLAAVKCVLTCEPEARTRQDLTGMDPAGWAALSVAERAAWTGIAAGRDCVPGASCTSICEGDYPPPEPVARRGAAATGAPAP